MIAICDKPKSKIHNEIQIKFLGRKFNYFLLRASGTFFLRKIPLRFQKNLTASKSQKKGITKKRLFEVKILIIKVGLSPSKKNVLFTSMKTL